MTTVPVVERIIIYTLIHKAIAEGVRTCDLEYIQPVLRSLESAIVEDVSTLPKEKQESALRHSEKSTGAIVQPFVDDGADCAKFALATFYAVDALIDAGLFIADNEKFASAMDALLSEGGSVSELANIESVDKSAQKQARKLLNSMQSLGYFGGHLSERVAKVPHIS